MPFIGDIALFASERIPKHFMPCDGQLLPIVSNQVLFSLIGVTYGGDGIHNFALPDFRGRVPLGFGDNRRGLSNHQLGEHGGSAEVTLTPSEIPLHSGAAVDQPGAGEHVVAIAASTPDASTQPHNNLQPYLALNFCIAVQGEFPRFDN